MKPSTSKACPLAFAAAGKPMRLERVTGTPDLKIHLAALGFVPGVELTILRRDLAGPLVVTLQAGRLVLGESIAQSIWVR